jgi:ribose transport system substrate-binding protein
MDRTRIARLFGALAGATLALSSVGSVAAQDGGYVIGFSNVGQVGNGWREEMVCSAKAQALKSGQVASMNIIHREGGPADQLADVRSLIDAGVDAIVLNPSSGDAINDAIEEAAAASIPVVVVDQAVTAPSAYLVSNDQEEYAYLGAKWLFEHLGGTGNVVYMGGAAGTSADNDRRAGWERAKAEFPDIAEVKTVQTDWQQATGVQQINDMFNEGLQFDGVWTSGIDNVIVTAFKDAGQPFVPIVGADGSEFVQQLVNEEGLVGALVTNPASVGGAGVQLALDLLNGETVEKVMTFAPALFENATDEGRAALEAAADPDIPPTWPIGITNPLTNYEKADILACKAPGE